jgi:serine/threonine protein kinase
MRSFPFSTGDTVGGTYALRKVVAAGASGTVWIARDEVLGRDVQLHFLPDLIRNDPEVMRGLRQEVKKFRQLIHPNVQRVHGLSEGNEWAAIAMELSKGESVAALLAKTETGCFEAEEIRGWLRQICSILGDAHGIQLFHRLLSPSYISVDADGEVLIGYFGIGRLIDDALRRHGHGDEEASGLGYFSPQQLNGEPPTAADDIYALGATIYELLTGEQPFTGGDLSRQIQNATPQPLLERRMALKRGTCPVPPTWGDAIADCLAKNPNDRPESANELARRFALGEKRYGRSVLPALCENLIAESRGPEQRATTEAAPAVSVRSIKDRDLETPIAPIGPESARQGGEVRFQRDETESIAHTSLPERLAARDAPGPRRVASYISESGYAPRRRLPRAPLIFIVALLLAGAGYHYFSRPNNVQAEAVIAAAHDGSSEVVQMDGGSQSAQLTESSNDDGTAVVTPDFPLVEPASLESGTNAPDLFGSLEIPEEALLTAGPLPVGELSIPDEEPGVVAEAPRVEREAEPSALQKARADADATARTILDLKVREQQTRKEGADLQKQLDDQKKATGPLLKRVTPLMASRKLREDEIKAADAAAQKAQAAADEKWRELEESKRRLSTFEIQNKAKLGPGDRAMMDLERLENARREKMKAADNLSQVRAAAEAARQAQVALVRLTEDALSNPEVDDFATADETARKIALERERQREKIESEIGSLKRALAEKIKAIEASSPAEPSGTGGEPPTPEVVPEPALPESASIGVPGVRRLSAQ